VNEIDRGGGRARDHNAGNPSPGKTQAALMRGSEQRGRAVAEWRYQLWPFIPDIPDRLIDCPDFQDLVAARPEQRQQLGLGCGLIAEPSRPVGIVKNDRHTIVQLTHRSVGAASQDRAA
jgi:hypothetical protein